MATAHKLNLPFSITEFANPRTGSVSFRVSGRLARERFRKNRKTRAEAQALCDFKNAEALRDKTKHAAPRFVSTTLTDDELLGAAAAVQKAGGRWALAEVLDAGISALEESPDDVELEPKFREWLKRVKGDLGKRWLNEIEHRGNYFFRQNKGLTARRFTPEFFSRWLAGLKCRGQTKANYRNAISRWAADMKAEGVLKVNPCKGLRITKRSKDKAGAPIVLSPVQAFAFLHVHVHFPELRPELGWVIECMLIGLRPQNEAPHAVWKEIDLEQAEQNVLGYKRGVKPRIVPLQPMAVDWLRLVRKEKRPQLAPYTRHLRLLAVKRANEWMSKHHPDEPPIKWDGDILRHTYASMRAAMGVEMKDLTEEMGTSAKMIYGHYRHVRPRRDAIIFWGLTRAKLAAS